MGGRSSQGQGVTQPPRAEAAEMRGRPRRWNFEESVVAFKDASLDLFRELGGGPMMDGIACGRWIVGCLDWAGCFADDNNGRLEDERKSD